MNNTTTHHRIPTFSRLLKVGWDGDAPTPPYFRSLAVAKDEGRAKSYVKLALNVLSTQPHRLFRFLPLPLLGGDDKELLVVLRFVRRSLFHCTKSLKRGLKVSALQTCDRCCYHSNLRTGDSNSADDGRPSRYDGGGRLGLVSEQYAGVEMLLRIVGGIGGNNLCDFSMKCAMRLVSRSLKLFTLGFSQQQSVICVFYSLDVLISIMEHCPLKSSTVEAAICYLLHLAITEYENNIAPPAKPSSPLDISCGWRQHKDDDYSNIHRRQWLVMRWALSVCLLKLSDRQFLYFKTELAIVFDVDELSEDEIKALSAYELMLEQRLADLHIIRQHEQQLYTTQGNRQRRSSRGCSNPDNDHDDNSLPESKLSMKRLEEDEEEEVECPVKWCRVTSQERLTCVLSFKFPKCLAFIQRTVSLKRCVLSYSHCHYSSHLVCIRCSPSAACFELCC